MRILIYGVTGQDGYYLSKQLLEQGHEVYGVVRRASSDNTQRIKNLNVNIIEGDINDSYSRFHILKTVQPERLYNLAAQSHVGTSFKQPELTLRTTGTSAIMLMNEYFSLFPDGRMYQASSSEMFGDNYSVRSELLNFSWSVDTLCKVKNFQFQDEQTPFSPQSPYAIAKLSAHYQARNLRNRGFFCCAGILFNHESVMRGDGFVTKKITNYLNNLNSPKENTTLKLGNLEASRDWGYAGDYTKAMQLIMEYDKADEFVISTGQTNTVKDFLEEAFSTKGLIWEDYVEIDQELIRPNEVPFLRGDSTKARRELGWKPEVDFKELVRKMVEEEE